MPKEFPQFENVKKWVPDAYVQNYRNNKLAQELDKLRQEYVVEVSKVPAP